ncbi:MAG: hypothetical protein HYS07_11445 [Chlamydiae bacterium]|nr:hypothetical protein [Chlamydiota bacterium]MBI3278101.1 hypothetical protein [Chlamydiota bacterium]
MITDAIRGLIEEKVVPLDSSRISKFPFPTKGIVRITDKKGKTIAILFSKEALIEFEEELEAANPAFIASLESARGLGRVSARDIKRKIGLSK